jgi:hypothetical protein
MPTNTYVALDKNIVAVATPSITLTGISGSYTDLVLVIQAKSTGSYGSFKLQVNSDTGTNYSQTVLSGSGSSTGISSNLSSNAYFDLCRQSGISSDGFGVYVVNLMNYSNTTTYKNFLSRTSLQNATGGDGVEGMIGMWRGSTGSAVNQPITSITISTQSGNIAIGSTFSLYGIKAEVGGSTPKATGGAITSDATYWYHTFTNAGNFVPNQTLSCDYLVVAGGGGSSSSTGGGGGAGGYRTSIGGSALSLTAGTYPVIVGAGGAAGTGSNQTSGSNSLFATILSTGGGYGGAWSVAAGAGGSGGGGGYAQSGSSSGAAGAGNTPSTTPSQGNNGGAGREGDPNYGAGGGGGAGAVGEAASTSRSGNGGVGVANAISGTSTYYAGGGGGGADPSRLNVAGTGGSGGGGNGGTSTVVATAGTVNTGGGAGGGTGVGKAGGSGIVIVRYTKA